MALRASVLLCAAVALLAPVGAASGRAKPALRIVDDLPLTLRGTNFRPRESVRITVVMGARSLSRQARAGLGGGFTIRFEGVRLDYCAVPLVIRARAAISGIVLARIPVRDCAQP
jgi:hypothetical protein